MEDHNKTAAQENNNNNSPNQGRERNEPIRTRWTPKPEQILILESIFNSGMVNPPKEETVRIRKMLEKFGAVGDANIFYWFQNRRSRSRRKQRQMQAASLNCTDSAAAGGDLHHLQQYGSSGGGGSAIEFNYCGGGYVGPQFLGLSPNSSSCYDGSSSSCSSSSYGLVDRHSRNNNIGGDEVLSFSGQMGVPGIDHSCSVGSIFGHSDDENLQYPSGIITVFINGVATEVPGGPIDMKTMFGVDVALVHSTGIPVPFNEYGFTLQGLHHGESYFLVTNPT